MDNRPLNRGLKLLLVLVVMLAGYKALRKIRHLRASAMQQSALDFVTVRASASQPSTIFGCPLFPADNVWNTPIDKLQKDPHSDSYIQSMGLQKALHPDFGVDPDNGIPFSSVDPGTPRVKVDFDNADESDGGKYPIPASAAVEGGSDAHLELVETGRCVLYELYDAHRQSDGTWKAGSGIRMDLTSNSLRGEGKTSADAAGLPILPGLVRYDEVAGGEISHALRFTVPKTQKAYIWPARHDASSIRDANFPPMGIRLRLRADFDITTFPKVDQIILIALKRYGMFLADNGSAFFLSGAPDKRWNDDELHHLNGVKGQDFEVVNESSYQMSPDSGRVDPKAVQH